MHWPKDEPINAVSAFSAWDAVYYLSLASNGYHRGTPECAFYPLWPGVIHALSSLFAVSPFWVGIILSNALSFTALLLFHSVVSKAHGTAAANATLLTFLVFPSAFFLNLIYSESLFLLLCVLFFYYLQRSRYFLASTISFLLPLTRAVGMFIIAPLLWHFWKHRSQPRFFLFAYFPVAGVMFYFLTMYFLTGNAFEGHAAQSLFPNRPSIANFFDLPQFLKSLLNLGSWHDMTNSILDRLIFLTAAAGLLGLWRLDTTYFAYAMPLVLVPAGTHYFFSYNRQVLMAFPLAIVYAAYASAKLGPYGKTLVALVLASVQLFLVFRYLTFGWAG
jgi:hypothetical protein